MTQTRNYVSQVSGRNTTPAQFITELMITRQAAKKGMDLPDKFWNMEEWKLEYKKQIVKANTFLKIYDSDIIVATLLKNENKWIHSLYFTKLNELIEETQNIVDREDRSNILEFNEDITSSPGKKYGTQSEISRMRELDNE